MKDLEFEYAYRWADIGPKLREAIEADDEPTYNALLALLESRDRALEDYLPGASGGCECARVWVDSTTTTLSLVSGTSTSGFAALTTINESEGEFSIAGGAINGPAGLYWYALSAVMQHGSGTSDVLAGVEAGIGATAYLPSGYGGIVPLSGWTTLPFQPRFSMSRPSPGTRSINASCSVYLWRMCGCTPTEGTC